MRMSPLFVPLFFLLSTALAAPPARAHDCGAPATVCEQATSGSMPLIERGVPLPVLTDDDDFPAVRRAADDVRADLATVADGGPRADPAPGGMAVIAGTLGRSARIDRIVRTHGLATDDLEGRWEAYSMQVVDAPEPGIARALVIVGADRRGTVFGLYELSRRIGVSPWTWWADVPPDTRTSLHIAPGRIVDAPAVRYRGIFINDEDPALGGWMNATYGGPDHRFYERVFQLILRHKGNYLWPAMWGRAFYDDDPANGALAEEMGVVIATSHHEPMMRAHVEWRRHGEGAWDYTENADALRAFWREGIARVRDGEAIVTLGMRGDGDEPMSEGTAIGLLEGIVADQRRIIAEVTGRPAEETPQVWALYKEVQDYLDAGMAVPDDVTLLFADDNWGNIRRLPQPGERREGGYGVYYHFDYVGGPRNHKWINTTQIERAWEQMRLAWTHGADRMWIVNVGDIKPMELPISFFLDQAWDPEAMTLDAMAAYPATWAAEQFGPAHAQDIGRIVSRYTQYNARRKPELLSPETYSLIHYGEADRVLAEWDALEADTLRVRDALPDHQRDAYYQLVEYPVLASANLNRLYVTTARNRLHALQGRATTNALADEVERLFARDAELARVYEQDVADGKWIHMMSQPRIGYTHWQQPDRNVMPALSRIDVRERGTMGVAVDGDARGWPVPAHVATLPPLDPHGAPVRGIDVFNRGAAPFRYSSSVSHPWLRLVPDAAEVVDARQVQVEIDWDAVPEGEHLARIDLLGSELTEVRIEVPVTRPPRDVTVRGFVESDGHVAIEAAHHERAVAADGLQWQVIPGLGRTLSAVTAWPTTTPAQTPGGDAPRLEYPVHLHRDGEVEVRVRVSPALDFQNRGGLRYAVSFDDAPPEMVTVRLDPTPDDRDFRAWERAVSDAVHVATSRHAVTAGARMLKLWSVDPGLVFQRVEIVRDGVRPSYLGPPESVRR
ncbi:glycosyl hydrolase 115 family protein [Luteimonas abyssi]|uniref:glycosyl hydrolase 115 family protein n=1 Tax=Luteimonas abyssi TaxID=1247514 RepID=UPI000B0927FF|nr:glycosyl hydrolase 115 family protein [Luteimonas abyssi]